MASNQQARLGLDGENAAARFLEGRGHTILDRRFRTNLGELDLITRSGNHLYFIEVKTRRFGSTKAPLSDALEAVNQRKQRRITQLAQIYIDRNQLWELTPHFSVIGIEKQRSSARLHFLPDAFDAC
ncbi:MAG: YraN family protein [Rickettsiales bacterium]|nr:YraN family protein [Rickettsiales bacterium]